MISWKQIRHRIEWLAVKAAIFFVPALPRPAIPFLAEVLGAIVFHLDKNSRTICLENLTVALGDRYTEAELRQLAKESFRYFAQVQIDAFWTSRLDADTFEDFVSYQFESDDIESTAAEKGAIWITPHYGNFEWIAMLSGYRGYSFKIIAQSFKNPLLDKLFASHREHSGHEVIPQKGATLKLLRHLKRKGHVAFLTDLSLAPERGSTIIECHGLLTSVTKLHADLASHTGVPLFPSISVPRPDGTYEMRVFRPIENAAERPAQEVAQECWNRIEEHLLDYPAPWLWMYKHWRFLPPEEHREGKIYPSYANRSAKFDNLLEELKRKN